MSVRYSMTFGKTSGGTLSSTLLYGKLPRGVKLNGRHSSVLFFGALPDGGQAQPKLNGCHSPVLLGLDFGGGRKHTPCTGPGCPTEILVQTPIPQGRPYAPVRTTFRSICRDSGFPIKRITACTRNAH